MADITITITDGTTTPAVITIPDARAAITADALCAATGVDRPGNDTRAVRRGVARWVTATRRQHRVHVAQAEADTALRAVVDAIEAEVDADDES